MRSRSLLLLCACLLAPACRTLKPGEAKLQNKQLQLDRPAPIPRAWTTAFEKGAVLVADVITIEGPADLLDHVVLIQDAETSVYSTKTITEGLLQELSARPEMGKELHGQLDGWSLAALRKITVLQRPGEVPVSVRASGSAYFVNADGSGEKRDNLLVFQGVSGH